MYRFLLAAGLTLCSGLVPANCLAGDTYRVEGPAGLRGFGLGAVDGKVRLVKINGGTCDWDFEVDEKKGVLIQYVVDRLDKYHLWYLSYDVTGKRKEVFLTRKPSKGSYWKAYPGNGSSLIAAKNGKLAGWTIASGGSAESLVDVNHNPFNARRAVLTKYANPAPSFKFVELSR